MVKLNTAVLATKPAKREETPVKCGFCLTGSCEQCPGATRGMQRPIPKIWVCACTSCNGGSKLRCLDCKSATPGEVSPLTWDCYDRDACNTRRTAKLKANPAYQIIDDIEEGRKMARVAAGKTAEKATRAPAAPKVGTCLVTGEPTKGGLFKPGMDARYVSERVAEVLAREVGKVAQRKRIKADGVSDALQAKFEKALTLAEEKAERAKEAAKAKPAPAKKAAAAPKETAAQKRKREAAEAAAAAEADDEGDEDDESGDEGDF
jgi:hypothetical protein